MAARCRHVALNSHPPPKGGLHCGVSQYHPCHGGGDTDLTSGKVRPSDTYVHPPPPQASPTPVRWRSLLFTCPRRPPQAPPPPPFVRPRPLMPLPLHAPMPSAPLSLRVSASSARRQPRAFRTSPAPSPSRAIPFMRYPLHVPTPAELRTCCKGTGASAGVT